MPSIYENRLEPAYRDLQPPSYYAENSYILKWWTPELDDLLSQLILEKRWYWYWDVTQEITNQIPVAIIQKWRDEDEIVRKFAWYNVIMNFAVARANQLRLTNNIPDTKVKQCRRCSQEFVENSLPYPLIARVGIDHIDYCSPCLSDFLFDSIRGDHVTKEQTIEFIQRLTETLGFVPPQAFIEAVDLNPFSLEERERIIQVVENRPSVKRIKEWFGSWFGACVQAGVLEKAVKTARGIKTIAKDGHVCLSLGEKAVDDYLYEHGIAHEKEPHYPFQGRYRSDFLVGNTYIEFFGMAGDAKYDEKTRTKRQLCEEHNIPLIALFQGDILSEKTLARKLKGL